VDVDECPHGVHPRVAVGHHHALGAGGGAARVVDRQEIVLADRRPLEDDRSALRRDGCDLALVALPPVARLLERDVVGDAGDPVAHAVDHLEVLG
jgi:hypothetical protein